MVSVQNPAPPTTAVDQLQLAVEAYGHGLERLRPLLAAAQGAQGARRDAEAGVPPEAGLEDGLMHALLARDAVRHALAAHGSPPPALMLQLAAYDESLRELSEPLTARVGRRRLREWSEMLPPVDREWWWRLDTVAADRRTTAHPLLPMLTRAIILVLSAVLALQIGQRFLRGGVDFLQFIGLSATLSTSLLAVVTASGRPLENFLALRGVSARLLHGVSAALAAFVLLLFILLWLSLPWWAQWETSRGTDALNQAHYLTATDRFKLALNLDPEDAAAYYYLGEADEELAQFDGAMSAYQKASVAAHQQGAAWGYAARNNLARLEMSQKGDYAGAYNLLRVAVDSPEFQAVEQCVLYPSPTVPACPGKADDVYKVYKNLAWANFGLHDLRSTDEALQKALAARPKLLQSAPAVPAAATWPTSATCLLGELRENQGQPDQARTAYQTCLAQAGTVIGDDVEKGWLTHASQVVNGG
jgi:tetratricopeptide (TPR) repeat protein